MAALCASLLLLGAAPSSAAVTEKNSNFLARDSMRPEVVAMSLGKVEDEWKNQYRLFVECNQTASSQAQAHRCLDAEKAFQRSCGKIVVAMVQASNGDRESVHEYMSDVCSEPELKGWHKGRCEILAATVLAGMYPDSYINRENLNTQPLCAAFWSRFSAEEAQVMEQERLEMEAREKKAQLEREEAEKRLAEEAAAEAKARAEEEEKQRQIAEQAEAEEKRKEQAEAAEAEAAAAKLGKQQEEEQKVAANATTESKAESEAAVNASTDKKEAVNTTQEAANNTEEAVTTKKTTNTVQVAANATNLNVTSVKEQVAQQNATVTANKTCTATVIDPVSELVVDIPNVVHGEVKFCGAGQLKVAESSCPISGHAFEGTLKTNGGASDCQDVTCTAYPCCMAYKCGGTEIAWER